MRYRDFGQDRRIQLTAIPVCVGEVGWRVVLRRHDLEGRLRADGAATVITRLALRSAPGPVTIASRLEADVTIQPARDETGRVYLNMWATLDDARDGTVAAHMFAEHVVTRLEGPRDARLVTRIEGIAATAPWARCAAEALTHPTPGWTPLGDTWVDPAEVVFGLDHTDGNRHVNTLVFPRLAIDAGLRRLAQLRAGGPLRATAMEVGYRKPCFAGERMRVTLRPFDVAGGAYGVCAWLSADEPAARPHITARILYEGQLPLS